MNFSSPGGGNVVHPLGNAAGLCRGKACAKELRGFACSIRPQQRWKRASEGKASSCFAFFAHKTKAKMKPMQDCVTRAGRTHWDITQEEAGPPHQPWFVLFSCAIHPRGLIQSNFVLMPLSNKPKIPLSLLEGLATPVLQPRRGKPPTDCMDPSREGSTRSPQYCPEASSTEEGKAEMKHPVNSPSITCQAAQHPESWRI